MPYSSFYLMLTHRLALAAFLATRFLPAVTISHSVGKWTLTGTKNVVVLSESDLAVSAAMMVLVETPDDAAYTFSHPAGGPTSMGPSWRAQLGRFAYPRSVRMSFLAKANYVDLCKR